MSDFQLKPADLPHWGQRTALRILGLCGWRMLYRPLPGPRGIAVIYPHTSNWDFMVGLFGKWSLNLPFRWLAKDSLFKTPLGGWFRSLGGEPVDRSAPNGMIRSQAERMNAADWYWLAITPEATRDHCRKPRAATAPAGRAASYHLALEAKVPLALVYLDYPNKTLSLIDHLHLSGDQEADMAAIRAVYMPATTACIRKTKRPSRCRNAATKHATSRQKNKSGRRHQHHGRCGDHDAADLQHQRRADPAQHSSTVDQGALASSMPMAPAACGKLVADARCRAKSANAPTIAAPMAAGSRAATAINNPINATRQRDARFQARHDETRRAGQHADQHHAEEGRRQPSRVGLADAPHAHRPASPAGDRDRLNG